MIKRLNDAMLKGKNHMDSIKVFLHEINSIRNTLSFTRSRIHAFKHTLPHGYIFAFKHFII